MILTGIDAAKSKEGEIVFRTEPPMTEAVLEELTSAWILGSEFGIDGELLVWRGGAYPERSLRQQTDIFLTEAERAVNAKNPGETKQPKQPSSVSKKKISKKSAGTKQHQEFLKKVSEQTGLPIV
jgi:hypothetical protein